MTREATPWLDLANIRFGIDRPAACPELLYDVIEVRVFDHATGKTLRNWELITPDTVQIRSVGTPLPDAVDLWFRMASHASETDRFELALSPGASLDLPGGTLTVREVHSGQPSYATKPGARKSSGTTVVLDWLGSAGSGTIRSVWPISRTASAFLMRPTSSTWGPSRIRLHLCSITIFRWSWPAIWLSAPTQSGRPSFSTESGCRRIRLRRFHLPLPPALRSTEKLDTMPRPPGTRSASRSRPWKAVRKKRGSPGARRRYRA